jgi:hypothetical protein
MEYSQGKANHADTSMRRKGLLHRSDLVGAAIQEDFNFCVDLLSAGVRWLIEIDMTLLCPYWIKQSLGREKQSL